LDKDVHKIECLIREALGRIIENAEEITVTIKMGKRRK